MAFVVFGIAVALVILVNLAGRWSRKMPVQPDAAPEPPPERQAFERAAPVERAVITGGAAITPDPRDYQSYSLEEVEELARARNRAVEIIPPKRRPQSAPEIIALRLRDASLTYQINYASEWGEVTDRRISVKRVYWDRGLIYVEAYCHLRKDKRTFRADRIEDLRDADLRYVGGALEHFGALIDPQDIITPSHELVMGKARAGLQALIWIARASGDLTEEDVALLITFCAERAKVGRGVTDFSEGLAERWIRDARPTHEYAAGGLAGIRRGGPEWRLALEHAEQLAAIGDAVKRTKRLARLFKP